MSRKGDCFWTNEVFYPLGKAGDLSMNSYGAAGRHSLPFVGLLAPKKSLLTGEGQERWREKGMMIST